MYQETRKCVMCKNEIPFQLVDTFVDGDWGLCHPCYANLPDINQPERSKREDHESGCGALNSMET